MNISFEQDRYEWNTLTQSLPARRRRWSFPVCLSSSIHFLVVVALCWPAASIFVKPVLIARGEGGSATPSSIVLFVPDDLQIATASTPPLLSLPVHKRTQKS